MTDLINDLDAAVTGEPAPDFEEQYPDAPPEAIETAKQIEANRQRIDALTEALERKKQRERETAKFRRAVLEQMVEEAELKVARLAVRTGTATEADKQRVKEAAADDEPDDLAAYFDPQNNEI